MKKNFISSFLALFFTCQCFSQSASSKVSAGIVRLTSVKTIKSGVILRSTPDINGTEILILEKGSLVSIIDYIDPYEYVKVFSNSTLGYCESASLDSLVLIKMRKKDDRKVIKMHEIEIGSSVYATIIVLGYPLDRIIIPTGNKEKWIYKDKWIYINNNVVDFIVQR